MANKDVTHLSLMGTSTPEEAAANIKGADQLGIPHDTFKDGKEFYVAAAEQTQQIKTASPAVAKQMVKSTEVASIIKEDLPIFEGLSNYYDLGMEKLKGADLHRDLSNLWYKKSKGELLTKDENNQLHDMLDRQEVLKTNKDFGYTEAEAFALDVGVVGVDMFKGLYEGKDILGWSAAIGIGGGALLGGLGAFILRGNIPKAMLKGVRVGLPKAFGIGIPAALIRDTYRMSRGQMYGELTVNLVENDPNFQAIAESQRKKIAKGAGALMAGISMFPMGYVMNKIPWMRKIVPKFFTTKFITSAKGTKFRKLLETVGGSSIVEAIEEGSQEAIQIIAGQFGPAWVGDEEGFIDSWDNVLEHWKRTAGKEVLTTIIKETIKADSGTIGLLKGAEKGIEIILPSAKRIGKAALLGGAAGGVLTTVAVSAESTVNKLIGDKGEVKEQPTLEEEVIQQPTPIVSENVNLPPVSKGLRAIQLQQIMNNTYQETSKTKLDKLVPKEMDEVRDNTFEDAGIPFMYFDKDDLTVWADTDEKAEDIREAIGGEITDGEINAPMAIRSSVVLRLMDKYKDITGLIKDTPENPTADQFIARVEERDRRLKELKKDLPKGEDIDDDILLDDEGFRDEDVFNEASYHEQPTFTKEMNKEMGLGISDAAILQINAAQLAARTQVADAINSERSLEMQETIDIGDQETVELERIIREERVQSEENTNIVEDFLENNFIQDDLNEFQKKRLSNDEPIYAINPDSLSRETRARMINNDKLKQRKVFNKDGIHVKDAVIIFGAKNPDDLLQILSETPTGEEGAKIRKQKAKDNPVQEKRQHSFFDNTETAKAYNNSTKNHIKEMKILLESSWPALKKGFKTIVFKLPNLSVLQSRARDKIGNTKLRSLNANKWEVGERKSQRKSFEHILKNKVEAAFREKENAAYNSQLAKETRVATGKMNNALRWLIRFKTARIHNVLKEAGKNYVQAAEDILSLFGSGKIQGEIDGYTKMVKEQVRQGKGNFEIPEAVMVWLEPTVSINEMTVDQVLELNKILRNIYHQARLKNKLMRSYTKFHEGQATHVIAEATIAYLQGSQKYDPRKAEEIPAVSGKGKFEEVNRIFNLGIASIQNIKFSTLELDDEREGGYMFNLIFKPIDDANKTISNISGKVRERFDAEIKKYGKGRWNALGRTPVTIKEFEHSKGLNNGELVKIDLMILLMNMGNTGNKEAVFNYGVDEQTIMDVLKRELGQEGFDFVQEGVWNIFNEEVAPLLQDVHKETTGTELTMVSFEGFEAFGKEYVGGYFPIKLAYGVTKNNALEIAKGLNPMSEETNKLPYNAYEGFVRSPHTQTRKGSKWIIDLDSTLMDNIFDEAIYDIGMRVPVRDVMQILNDAKIATAIKAVIGPEKYDALHGNVAKLTHSVPTQDLKIHQDVGKYLFKVARSLENATILNWLIASPSTIAIQFLALREIGGKMGVDGSVRLAATMTRLTGMLFTGQLNKAADFAASIDPSLYSFREGIDEIRPGTLTGRVPKTRFFDARAYHGIKELQELITDKSISGILGYQDAMFKTAAVITAYNQYMAGSAPGHPQSEVMLFSQEERIARAKVYAQSVVASTTMRARSSDKSVLQDDKVGRYLSRLWNEVRNLLNNRISTTRQIGYDGANMLKAVDEGDFTKASLAFDSAAGNATKLIMLAIIGRMMTNLARGNEPFPEEADDPEPLNFTEDQFSQFPQWFEKKVTTVKGGFSLLNDTYGSNIPVIRDAIYGVESGRGTSFPVISGITTLGKGTKAGLKFLNELVEGATWVDAWAELSEFDRKQLYSAAGILAGGLPVSAAYKWDKLFEEVGEQFDLPDVGAAIGGELMGYVGPGEESWKSQAIKKIEAIIEKNEDNNIIGPILKEFKARLALIKGSGGLFSKEQITNAIEVIKFAESEGIWNAKNPRSTARGLYQFTDQTWEFLVNTSEGEEAGLTLNGRESRDSIKQQEAAMIINTNRHINTLHQLKIPITEESIYYMHHFDKKSDAKKIFLGKDSDSMRSTYTLSKKVKLANPGLKKAKTVGDVKKYLNRLLNKGRKLQKESKN